MLETFWQWICHSIRSLKHQIKTEQTAQAILDAHVLYPDRFLRRDNHPPLELRKTHQQNGKTVMMAYGFWRELNSEPDCVAELMRMY